MRVEIVPGTLRDYTYVAANIRPEDRAEIEAQVSHETQPVEVAVWSLTGREAWTALYRGQPVAAFGIHNATPAGNVCTIWCWGTARMTRAIPEISRFIRWKVPQWIEQGMTRVEARSIVGHTSAHRWMTGLGGKAEPLPAWGKGGEDFILFSWTRETWNSTATPSSPSAHSGRSSSAPSTSGASLPLA